MVSDGNFFRQTRVKAIDYHPTEPCMAVGMHSGRVTLYDENSGSLLQSIQATTDPVRCVKFVARKQWLLAGSDDKMIHVFHSQTLAKIVEFQAHDDYLRWIEIHPTLPCFLSASDDFTIKIWNWDRNFDCTHVFTGHSHYVMQVKINPIDTNTFASAALDWNVKLWSLSSSVAQHTLTGHERGVNSIEYFPPGEKPYIVSAADDCSIKVWNYQTKSLVCTLTGHTHNVSAVVFHPRLPLFISVSEDHTAHVYHCTSFKCETVVQTMDLAWAVAASPRLNRITIGSCAGWESIELCPETSESKQHTDMERLCGDETIMEFSPRHVLQSIVCSDENEVRLEGQVVDISCAPLVVRHDKEPSRYQQCLSRRCFLIAGCLSFVVVLEAPGLALLVAACAFIGCISVFGFLSYVKNGGQKSVTTDDIELGTTQN